MREDVNIVIKAGALSKMTVEQFESLRKITDKGNWETVETDVHVSGTEYLGVYLPGFFIGIEKDGYAHS